MGFEIVIENFKKKAAKTPAEMARDKVLERRKLDEESYKRLPPVEKRKIDAEIAGLVERMPARRYSGRTA